MGIFFSLFFESVTCLFYGIIIVAFIMVTLYFILKMMSKGAVHSIPFYISGMILAILLLINMSVMVGAFTVKQQTDSMRLWLAQQLDGTEGIADLQSSQMIGDSLNDEFPLLGCFLNLFDLSGHAIEELPQVFYEVINHEMNTLIWSKILWSLIFCIAAVLVALYFDKGDNKNTSKVTKHRYSSRRNPDDF